MLEAYFMLSGRMRRLPYLGYSLLLVVLVLVIGGIGASQVGNARFPTIILIGALLLFLGFAGFALGVKRCHDLDKSGWLYFWIAFVPGALSTTFSLHINGITSEFSVPIIGGLAGLVALVGGLYLLFARGTNGPNKYGYPPEAT